MIATILHRRALHRSWQFELARSRLGIASSASHWLPPILPALQQLASRHFPNKRSSVQRELRCSIAWEEQRDDP
jgi:hypothetical protein